MARATKFTLERQFYPHVASAAVSAVGRVVPGGMRRILRETLVGRVFPDLLIGEWPSKQHPFSARRLTSIECAILHALDWHASTAEDLESGRNTRSVIGQARSRLAVLERLGLVHADESGRWFRTRDTRLDRVRLTAIEAKLSRWEEALAQALTVRLFVHRAYIMLNSPPSAINAATEALRETGVGLLVRRGKQVDVVLRAANAVPTSHEWIIAVDKLLHRGAPRLVDHTEKLARHSSNARDHAR